MYMHAYTRANRLLYYVVVTFLLAKFFLENRKGRSYLCLVDTEVGNQNLHTWIFRRKMKKEKNYLT